MPLRFTFAFLAAASLSLSGCGSSTPAPANPTPAADAPASEPDAPAETAPPSRQVASCDEACTEVAVCSEEIDGEAYTHGGACVEACEDNTPEEQEAYFECVRAAASCAVMVGC